MPETSNLAKQSILPFKGWEVWLLTGFLLSSVDFDYILLRHEKILEQFPPLNSFPTWIVSVATIQFMKLKNAIMRKLYKNFHIFHFQERIVSAETICGNAINMLLQNWFLTHYTSRCIISLGELSLQNWILQP